MRPLTLDDLLPLEEFAGRRREFFDSLNRYLDRYRRIRIGPSVVLLFENRQTLWFRVQEIVRVARLSEPTLVQQQLDAYNRILPVVGRLQAALLIEATDPGELFGELAAWRTLSGDALAFRLGETSLPATVITCRPEDRAIGAAHWVQFALDKEARSLLADSRQSARFEIRHGSYAHRSSPLSEEVRQSLLDDLAASDRDSAA